MNEGYREDCYLDREGLSASCSNVVFKALLIPREIDMVPVIVGLSRDLAPRDQSRIQYLYLIFFFFSFFFSTSLPRALQICL